MNQYIVQTGDYPIKIAKKFGMTLAEFQSMNLGLVTFDGKWQVLFPGQLVNVKGVVTGVPASSGGLTSAPVVAAPASGPVPPPWMQLAIMELGVHEWNPGDNPRILEYLASVGLSGPDETSWCASFVNWCLRKSGFQGANSGMVSDWFGWGRSIAPTYGAVVIFQPLAVGASGHIGFVHALDQKNVWTLSGNSQNQVRIAAYPKSKLIHTAPFRWPY
ncbi:MAG: LysM peptidoglycan-binding domain-containing protein [Verrucomicrobiaceae bacterium]|nr:LysM peptidoglycan-binding domain-containing protein [Verrucomicrobiaceae bacterium]